MALSKLREENCCNPNVFMRTFRLLIKLFLENFDSPKRGKKDQLLH